MKQQGKGGRPRRSGVTHKKCGDGNTPPFTHFTAAINSVTNDSVRLQLCRRPRFAEALESVL